MNIITRLLFFVIIFCNITNAQTWKTYIDKANTFRESAQYDSAGYYAELAVDAAEKQFGADDTVYSTAIRTLAYVKLYTGNTEEAAKLLFEAAEIIEKQAGKDNPLYGFTLNDIGEYYYETGDIKRSVLFLDSAEAVLKKIYPDNPLAYLVVIQSLGSIYTTAGDYKTAEKFIRQSVEITEEAYGREDFEYGFSLYNLGLLFQETGRFEEGISIFKEVGKIFAAELGETHPYYAYVLKNIAAMYKELGKYLNAEVLYMKVLDIDYKTYGEGNASPVTLNNLGNLYSDMGMYSKADELYSRALETAETQLGREHPTYITCLYNTASLYSTIGKYSEAERLYKKIMIKDKETYGEVHPYYANDLNNLCVLFYKMGRFDEAIELGNKALNIIEQLHGHDNIEYAKTLGNISGAWESKGELEKALELQLEATEIMRTNYGNDIPDLKYKVNGLGIIYQKLGRLDEAEECFKEALDIHTANLGTNHPDYALFLNNVAGLSKDKNQFDKAVDIYKKSLEVYRNSYGDKHPLTGTSFGNVGKIYYLAGNFDQAKIYFDRMLDNYENQIDMYFDAMSEKEKTDFYETLKRDINIFYAFAVDYSAENPDLIKRMLDIRLKTKALLLKSSRNIRQFIYASGDSALIDLFEAWRNDRELLASLYAMSVKQRNSADINIDSLENSVNELEKELSSRSALFTDRKKDNQDSGIKLLSSLKNDEAAIEIIRIRHYNKELTDSVYYAFLLLKSENDKPEIIIIPDGNRLENEGINLYSSYIHTNTGSGEDLFRLFWKPVSNSINDKKKIYLSVDGVYNFINLYTLINPSSGNYLLDDIDLYHLTNLKGIYNRDPFNTETGNAVLFGFPDYQLDNDIRVEMLKDYADEETRGLIIKESAEDKREFNLVPLPGTAVEVLNINDMLVRNYWVSTTYTEERALEEAVKDVKSPTVLHIATHGYFSSSAEGVRGVGLRDPLLRSYLFFSGSGVYLSDSGAGLWQGEDGILTAYEAVNLNLSSTELVVLSACETGLGEVSNGEGVYGLQRAFQTAGADAVVMSLWSVSDKQTRELMQAFYRHWLQGTDKNSALKKAMQEIKSKYPEPFYWGAFILSAG